MIKKYMASANNKIIGYADTEALARDIIRHHFNAKKSFAYELLDIETPEILFIDDFIKQLKNEEWQAKWQSKGQKKARARRGDTIDEKYGRWLGTQSCVITGRVALRGAGAENMHCHHIHGRGHGRNDYAQVPLLGIVHTWGSMSYHSCTKADFIKNWQVDAIDIIEFFEGHAERLKKEFDNNK